jgi:hypothetical protein
MAEILKFKRIKVSPEPSRREMWLRFRDDRELRVIHQISDHEMALLERTALLGEFHSTEDLLFVLKTIRGGAYAELQNDDCIQRDG